MYFERTLKVSCREQYFVSYLCIFIAPSTSQIDMPYLYYFCIKGTKVTFCPILIKVHYNSYSITGGFENAIIIFFP